MNLDVRPIFLDLETYFDTKSLFSLKNLSDVRYIMDPRFHVLSVAIMDDQFTRVFPGDSQEWESILRTYIQEGRWIVAHNARFDLRVLSLRYGILPLRAGDTMLMARYLGFPKCNLAELSKILLTESKGELTTDGKALSALTEEDWLALANYNTQDVFLVSKLYETLLPRLPRFELDLIDQTLRLCLTPICINENNVHEIKRNLLMQIEDLKSKDSLLFENRMKPIAVRKILRDRFGEDPGSIDKKKVDLQRMHPEACNQLKLIWEIKEFERELTLLSNLKERMSPAFGFVSLDLNYSKAVTHRWSSGGDGSESFNMQNIGRGSKIRELWVPQTGKLFVIVDLSQIEARIAAWVGDEKELLDAFTKGRCVYCEFGQHIFGHVLNAEQEKDERAISKQAVLGLQFGMGSKRFLETMKSQCPNAVQKVMTSLCIENEIEFSKKVVATYRQAYMRLAGLPKAFFDAILQIVANNGSIEIGGIGKYRFEYNAIHRFIKVTLATGGIIYYRDVQASVNPSKFGSGLQSVISYATQGNERREFTFSSPFENIVQATARDILGFQLLTSEQNGLKPRMHMHDEVIFEVEEKTALDDLKKISTIFSKNQETCPGLPISCKAFLSDRYTKDERYMKHFTETLQRNIHA